MHPVARVSIKSSTKNTVLRTEVFQYLICKYIRFRFNLFSNELKILEKCFIL
jgi:hypothetical protein